MKKWCVGWGAVPLCNMNCQFCYSKNIRSEDQNEVSLSDWKSFIDNNHKYIDSINYGTGENALSNEWFELLSYVNRVNPNIKQGVTTNGYLSEAVKYDACKKEVVNNCLAEIDVSLDYCDENKHNAFRGQPKAFQWVKNTIKEYAGKKLVTLVMLGTDDTLNKNNISGMQANSNYTFK